MSHPSLTMFMKLTEQELRAYAEQARRTYIPGDRINPLWHPAYRVECEKMNLEWVQSQTDDNGFIS